MPGHRLPENRQFIGGCIYWLRTGHFRIDEFDTILLATFSRDGIARTEVHSGIIPAGRRMMKFDNLLSRPVNMRSATNCYSHRPTADRASCLRKQVDEKWPPFGVCRDNVSSTFKQPPRTGDEFPMCNCRVTGDFIPACQCGRKFSVRQASKSISHGAADIQDYHDTGTGQHIAVTSFNAVAQDRVYPMDLQQSDAPIPFRAGTVCNFRRYNFAVFHLGNEELARRFKTRRNCFTKSRNGYFHISLRPAVLHESCRKNAVRLRC
jgi:hypothetical protein